MSVPPESRGHLPVAHVLAEIDVEDVSFRGHQNVVVVPVSYSQHVRDHAPRRARAREILRCLKIKIEYGLLLTDKLFVLLVRNDNFCKEFGEKKGLNYGIFQKHISEVRPAILIKAVKESLRVKIISTSLNVNSLVLCFSSHFCSTSSFITPVKPSSFWISNRVAQFETSSPIPEIKIVG